MNILCLPTFILCFLLQQIAVAHAGRELLKIYISRSLLRPSWFLVKTVLKRDIFDIFFEHRPLNSFPGISFLGKTLFPTVQMHQSAGLKNFASCQTLEFLLHGSGFFCEPTDTVMYIYTTLKWKTEIQRMSADPWCNIRGHLFPSPSHLYGKEHCYDITDLRINKTVFYCFWL